MLKKKYSRVMWCMFRHFQVIASFFFPIGRRMQYLYQRFVLLLDVTNTKMCILIIVKLKFLVSSAFHSFHSYMPSV